MAELRDLATVADAAPRAIAKKTAKALQARPARRQGHDGAVTRTEAGLVRAAETRMWPAQERATATVWFDHTDLAHYFSANRTPTGIQRVEIEIYRATRRRSPTSGSRSSATQALACCFDPDRRCWVRLPAAEFDALCGLLPDGSERAEPASETEWAAQVAALPPAIALAPPVPFQRQDVLVTVGASWWIADYLQFVRHLQHERGVLYAPFLHDVIPLLVPEFCAAGLVAEFRDWFATAMHAADLTFANSRCTARDVARCAEASGLPIPAPHVVRLDAHAGVQRASGGGDHRRAAITHARLGVNRPFALFVATIEARKDHIFVFRCWQQLIERHGPDAVPDLLCVGKPGWLVDYTLNWLRVNPRMAAKIRLLGTVSDGDLAGLYATADFCVYNSHYEGWGLPVTESLCHGRVALVPRHSSLPEAGGVFAVYFEPGSPDSFLEQVTRLLDPMERAGHERRIRSRFRPRAWGSVLEQVVTTAAQAPLRPRPAASGVPLEIGSVYSFARRQTDTPLARGRNGQVLLPGTLARFGLGWWLPEEWGCWSRLPESHLLFSVPGDALERRSYVYVLIRGGPSPQTVTLAAGRHALAPAKIAPHRRHLFRLPLEALVAGTGDVLIGLGSTPYSLADHTGGQDARLIGFGLEAAAVVAADDVTTRQDILEMAVLAE